MNAGDTYRLFLKIVLDTYYPRTWKKVLPSILELWKLNKFNFKKSNAILDLYPLYF